MQDLADAASATKWYTQEWVWVLGQFVVLFVQAMLTVKIIQANTHLARDTHRLAEKTKELVKASVDATSVADRHHQESLAPVIVPVLGLAREGWNDTWHYMTKGSIYNVGLGPAVRVKVTVTPLGSSQESAWVGAIGPGKQVELNHEWFIARDEREDPTPRRFPFAVEIAYQNLFEAQGLYKASSSSGDDEDLVAEAAQSVLPPVAHRKLSRS